MQRYSSGAISSRQAARELGTTENSVFAAMVAARLPLPTPPAEELAQEIAALRNLYGPHVPHRKTRQATF